MEDANGGKRTENNNLLVLPPLFLSKLDCLHYYHLVVISDEINTVSLYILMMLMICYAQL